MSSLPKWFDGEVYTEGATVQNRFGGDSCYLNAEELSMYDFIMGCSMVFETMPSKASNKIIDEFHKGLGWFAKNNPDAYMKLLD
mgnify:FL=1